MEHIGAQLHYYQMGLYKRVLQSGVLVKINAQKKVNIDCI